MSAMPPPPATPSLLGSRGAAVPPPTEGPRQARNLFDLMYDGFYLLFLLRNGTAPADAQKFLDNIQQFLQSVERGAKKLSISAEDIFAAKYAFCATVDEFVLGSSFPIREAWERRPLQLTQFGDQLAGENFFVRLQELQAKGAAHLQALEIYYLCLLLGFRGKYILEGPEKLSYLTARLGDEIAYMKGKRPAFAPHWPPPDQIAHALKRETPLWAIAAVFALAAILGYLGLSGVLARHTDSSMSAYENVIQLAPTAANLTITLP